MRSFRSISSYLGWLLALLALVLALGGGCASEVALKEQPPPAADAGPDRLVYLGDKVVLDASQSVRTGSDAELDFHWRLLQRPAEASAELSSEETAQVELTPDALGTWTVSLVVRAGARSSLPELLRIEVQLRPCETDGECAASEKCCGNRCLRGVTCCADADCDDDNACTADHCIAGGCVHDCTDSTCLKLRAPASLTVNTPAQLRLDSCGAAISPGQLECDSDRNLTGSLILQQGFESGLSPLNTTTSAQLHLRADAQYPGSSGAQGMAICGQGGSMWYELVATGHKDLAVRVSATNPGSGAGLPDGSMLRMDFSRSVSDNPYYSSLALFGDGLAQPWQRLGLLLPVEVEGYPQVGLGFYVNGPSSASQCVLIDDLTIQDLPDATGSRAIWQEDFGAPPCSLTSAVVVDPAGSGAHVALQNSAGNCYARLTGNFDEALVSPPIDTSSLSTLSDLLLSWRWARETAMLAAVYFLVEYSTDGETWRELAGTGNGINRSGTVDGSPADWLTQRALLPGDARGIRSLRLRFIGPASSGAADQAVRIDDVVLSEVTRAWTDRFGQASDLGQGRFAIPATPTQTGGAVLFQCGVACGGSRCDSNTARSLFFASQTTRSKSN